MSESVKTDSLTLLATEASVAAAAYIAASSTTVNSMATAIAYILADTYIPSNLKVKLFEAIRSGDQKRLAAYSA